MSIADEIGKASGGYAIEDEHGHIYVPVVMAARPGNGEGGKFLDGLPRDLTIKFPCVVSPILAGMLERRGFVITWEYAEQFGEHVQVYVRWAERRATVPL